MLSSPDGLMLEVGAAEADITPHNVSRTWLAGFGINRRARGVLEPLRASALFLRAGERRVALLALDLLGIARPWVEQIRAAAHLAPDMPLLCACTHTHAGPDTLGLWGRGVLGVPLLSGVDPRYREDLVRSAAGALASAVTSAAPATLRMASFEVPETWTRNERRGGARADTAVAVACDAESGGRIATWLCHASHPETLWSGNRLLSPDFPGAFRARTQELAGGVALYTNGALGAMLTPNVPADASDDARRSYARDLGRTLAELAQTALAAERPARPDVLLCRTTEVALVNHNWRFSLLQALGLCETPVEGGRVRAPVHYLRLGDLELLSAPGEVAPELGARIRERLSARHRMLLGLCGEEVGYILEPAMYDDPEYAHEAATSLGRPTADALLAGYDALLEKRVR